MMENHSCHPSIISRWHVHHPNCQHAGAGAYSSSIPITHYFLHHHQVYNQIPMMTQYPIGCISISSTSTGDRWNPKCASCIDMEHDCTIIIHFLQVQQFQHQEHQQCTHHGKYGKVKSWIQRRSSMRTRHSSPQMKACILSWYLMSTISITTIASPHDPHHHLTLLPQQHTAYCCIISSRVVEWICGSGAPSWPWLSPSTPEVQCLYSPSSVGTFW